MSSAERDGCLRDAGSAGDLVDADAVDTALRQLPVSFSEHLRLGALDPLIRTWSGPGHSRLSCLT